MKQGINSYQGLNKDVSYDSIPNTFYIDAMNVRVTTVQGESQGAVTNIRGNSLYFDLDTTGTFNSLPWTAANPEIIGSTSIRNKIIIFVADDSTTKGWIYTIEYDETNSSIIGTPTLKYYNPNLNFKKTQPIEAVGRFESDCFQRLYWTDYDNYFRSINLEDSNLETFSIGLIDAFPNVEFTLAQLTLVLGGGTLLAGTYQYTYRLKTSDGKQTLIAPGGNLIHCVSHTETDSQSAGYNGDPQGTNTGKSHEITIDTSNYAEFESIELISIFYEDLTSSPIITSIEEKNIIGASTSFVHTGTENTAVILSNFEYTARQYPFKTFKTLVPKDNSLVVANIKAGQFSIDELLGAGETFSASTLRYKSDGITTPPSGVFNTEYNKDAHWDDDWHNNQQFKFQSNGTRLGGTGANISYNFHLEPFIIDGDQQAGFANVSNVPGTPPDLNDGYTNINTTYPSKASPFISGLIKSNKRGETYRVGIVVYNLKGEASFVEHIGDIKFPDVSDADGVNNSSGTVYFPLSQETARNTPTSITTTAYAMGLEFTIDFSTCPIMLSQITGYQIVRVKREESDTRRLCSGIMRTAYSPANIQAQTGGQNYPDLQGPGGAVSVFHMLPFSTAHGANANMEYTLNTDTAAVEAIRGQYINYHFPEIAFDSNNVGNIAVSSSNAYLLMTGAYAQYFSTIGLTTPATGAPASRIAISNQYEDINSFDLFESLDTSSTEFLGTSVIDFRRKMRTVVPVDKSTGALGIEYIKKWKEKAKTSFINTQDDSDLSLEVTQNTFDFDNNYFRNFYASAVGGTVDDLNNLQSGTPSTGTFYKGATGLIGLLEEVSTDPLTNVALSPVSALPYFDTVTGGVSTVVPTGLTIYDEASLLTSPITVTELNEISTPLLDIVLPKLEIYGGFTTDAVAGNTFIPASPFIEKSNLTPKVFGGDIFLNMWTMQEAVTCLDRRFYPGAISTGGANTDYRINNTITNNFVIESSINLALSYGSTLKTGVEYDVFGGPSGVTDERYRQETNNEIGVDAKVEAMYEDAYNEAYSREKEEIFFFAKPDTFDNGCNTNDIRAYLSNVKTNEEAIDSWTQFGANNFRDVDDYGAINKILNWRDTVYYLQDRAVGAYSINPRAIISTADGIPTELGSGEGFQDHQYISTDHGSIHQWAVQASDTGIYYFDGIHRKIFRIGQQNEPLSEIGGMHSLLNSFQGDVFLKKENGGDNPIIGKGVHISRDKINDEILFTFMDTKKALALTSNYSYTMGDVVEYLGIYYAVTVSYTSSTTKDFEILLAELVSKSTVTTLPQADYTLVYDELLQKFSSFYTAVPSIYMENGDILLSPDPANKENIYIHNKGNWGEFYDTIEESYISLVINHNADINKLLRFIEFNSIVRDNNKNIDRDQTITAFKVTTEYQDTGKILFSTGKIKRRFDNV
jgi:hypothetical protein